MWTIGRAIASMLLALTLAMPALPAAAREVTTVATEWRSILFEGDSKAADQPFERPDTDDRRWNRVSVPHNWQGYAYARQVVKGARHGTAWYRTRLTLAAPRADERISLMFEGVNSYATVWLNGRPVGRHAGGLTSFTLDVTDAVRGGANVLAVRVDNPAGIEDLPWISGDDRPQAGCCEGSQPFGIFRPVRVVRTAALRIRPFGIYAWGAIGRVDATAAHLTMRTEVENASPRARSFAIVGQMVDAAGRVVAERRSALTLAPGASQTVEAPLPRIDRPRLWSPASPTLYTLRARIVEGERTIDELATPYGIRTFEIRTDASGARRLFLNGQPFHVKGISEYEHLLGGSHAFAPEQAVARVAQVRAAGFNAFRDGHYPHNFVYGDTIARDGLLWWPQFSSGLWIDTPSFRANFRALIADWVRERRNNPAVFLWGLQNESKLPKEFAAEMTALIRTIDPTASQQRLVVTCNGGEGSDWNVPQNWSGTYGGDPALYAQEMVKQGLVGEYGAWRALGLHAEAPYGERPFSEDRMAALMQTKARLADSVADRSVGHFHWLLTTHENPGRPMRADGTQIWDGVRALDHVGPANNKGLMTLAGEPLDVYYMFRARQVPALVAPMVHIVSHTWPGRWAVPGVRSGIEVYSNCDAVELFNDGDGRISLGRRRRDAEERFRWDGVTVRYGLMSATCRVGGKVAARDVIRLPLLPPPPGAKPDGAGAPTLTKGAAGLTYLYRVNAGGPALTDASGQAWAGDRHWTPGARWGWTSWADAYRELDPMLGSRGVSSDVIAGTDTPALFRTHRYGREALRYRFAVPDGRYRIELYFAEGWYGRAGIDARGWRRFDVAVNGRTLLKDVDVFAEAGVDAALKKVVTADVRGGTLELSFPRVAAGQAMIAAIAIASDRPIAVPAVEIDGDLVTVQGGTLRQFVDIGDTVIGSARWAALPAELLDSDGVTGATSLRAKRPVTLYRVAAQPAPGWEASELTGTLLDGSATREVRFETRKLAAGETLALPVDNVVLVRRTLVSPYAPGLFTFAKDAGLKEAEAATLNGASIATALKGYGGQGYVALGSEPAKITWPIDTGVAASHRFRFRYWLAGAATKATVTILDASGIVVATMTVAFAPSDAWREVTVETPGMINAGSYRLTLAATGADGLAIDSVRVD
ncbi:malectin domain-containing carbohydrate-binding protein [Sphingomonas floccifaciens]|uniref:Malectin domain-containing carbohydrate-binding protein n=1 Tax=Sphingomonas floccifaciens TaxID=1844115 RepID=A0ABW4NEF9_9SPHN